MVGNTTVVAVGLAALAAGCTVPGRGPDRMEEWTVELPARVTAWLVADACRVEHGGADPMPMHAGAPVLHPAPGLWQVRYDGQPDGGHRVHMDGRLLPPPVPRLDSLADGPRPAPIAPGPFEPAPTRTGATESSGRGLTATIRALDGDRCRLVLWWRGGEDSEHVYRHVHRLLDLAVDIRATGDALDARRFAETPGACAEALRRFGSGCCAHHRAISVRLWIHRTQAEHAMDRLDAALTSAQVARGTATDVTDLDLWIGELAQRLGRDEVAERAWLRLQLHSPDLATAMRAAHALRRAQHRLQADAPAPLFRAEAEERLERGDRESAAYLLESARILAPYAPENLDLLRRFHREVGNARRVLEVTLLRAEQDLHPGVARALVEAWNGVGEPTHALRALVRHWDLILGEDPVEAHGLLLRQLELLGREQTCRILASERAFHLLRPQLVAWAREGDADPAGLSLLSGAEERHQRAILRGMQALPPRPGR